MKRLLLTLALLMPFAAHAIPVAHWVTTGPSLSFEVTHVSGGINAGGDLEFGLYPASNPLLGATVFDGGISVGDFLAGPATPGSAFGLYIANVGTGYGGPRTHYSDRTLNPMGLEAMDAVMIGPDSWEITMEDLHLPVFTEQYDLRIIMMGANPLAVPAPAALALLGLGCLLVLRRRNA